MKAWKVTFEHVSAVRHPEYYRGSRPCVAPADVPDEHWSKTEAEKDEAGARAQLAGLQRLVADGELVRNPQLWASEDLRPVRWQEVPTSS